MPALDNPRWERFARQVASGSSQRAAYKACGYTAKDPDSAASDLASKPQVKARIKELSRRCTDKAMERAAFTKSWVMNELRDNAEKAAEVKGGSSVRNRALELIGKELGMFGEREPLKPLTLEDLSTEDLEKLLALPVRDEDGISASQADQEPVQ